MAIIIIIIICYPGIVETESSTLSLATAERGCSPKKEVGTPETRLRQRFFKRFIEIRPTYTYTHTVRKIATADLWSCPAIQLLVLECL